MLQIHICQVSGKPSGLDNFPQGIRPPCIDDIKDPVIARFKVLYGVIDPFGRWWILGQGMGRGDVIDNMIHDDFYPKGLAFIYQFPVSLEIPQMWLNGIEICRRVSMIAVDVIVFKNRCHPKNRDSQIPKVIQLVDHALKIPTAPAPWVFRTYRVFVARDEIPVSISI
jgi:hypothetical protein